MGHAIGFLPIVREDPKGGDVTAVRNGNHCGSRHKQTACGGT
ncbi:hypothetical protein [Streptomyces sp. NPDC047999]